MLISVWTECKADPTEMDRYKPWDAVYGEQSEDNQLTGCIDAGLNLLKSMWVFTIPLPSRIDN